MIDDLASRPLLQLARVVLEFLPEILCFAGPHRLPPFPSLRVSQPAQRHAVQTPFSSSCSGGSGDTPATPQCRSSGKRAVVEHRHIGHVDKLVERRTIEHERHMALRFTCVGTIIRMVGSVDNTGNASALTNQLRVIMQQMQQLLWALVELKEHVLSQDPKLFAA